MIRCTTTRGAECIHGPSNGVGARCTTGEGYTEHLRVRQAPAKEDGSWVVVEESDARTDAVAAATVSTDSSCITFRRVQGDFPNGGAVELEGVIASRNETHALNGSSFTVYLLVLPAPRCVEGLERTRSVSEVQVAGEIDVLKELVGKRVRIWGDTFPEMTAWHVRPVLFDPDVDRTTVM